MVVRSPFPGNLKNLSASEVLTHATVVQDAGVTFPLPHQQALIRVFVADQLEKGNISEWAKGLFPFQHETDDQVPWHVGCYLFSACPPTEETMADFKDVVQPFRALFRWFIKGPSGRHLYRNLDKAPLGTRFR